MSEFIFGLFTVTGGIFWILTLAWLSGWISHKLGWDKYL